MKRYCLCRKVEIATNYDIVTVSYFDQKYYFYPNLQNKSTSVIAKELFEKMSNEDKDPEIILKTTMDIKASVSESKLFFHKKSSKSEIKNVFYSNG